MATETCTSTGEGQIGEAAGMVWRALLQSGPLTAAKLVREVEMPRDVAMQAVGWLAREDKLMIEEGPRSRLYSLKSR
jgi:hypothetical protein